MQKVTIIAGPCSVDDKNINEIKEIAEITVRDGEKLKKAVWGTRVVGLKSRTGWNPSGFGMGMDHEAIISALSTGDADAIWPSMQIAKQIVTETGLAVATEIMLQSVQLPLYEKIGIPNGKLLAWNPATNQLGWPILETAMIAKRNNWLVGLKNPKWIGEHLNIVEDPAYTKETSFEKQWQGSVDYASPADTIVLIHRGVDVPDKGIYRSPVVHQSAKRVKNSAKRKYPNKDIRLFFDPSHSLGPKMREQIPAAIVDALKLRNGEEYLYDGLLVETGTSTTDTEQHITLTELRKVIDEIAKFRIIMERE